MCFLLLPDQVLIPWAAVARLLIDGRPGPASIAPTNRPSDRLPGWLSLRSIQFMTVDYVQDPAPVRDSVRRRHGRWHWVCFRSIVSAKMQRFFRNILAFLPGEW